MRTTLDTSKQEQAIEQLGKDNARLHPGLEILRVAWPKKVIGSGKAFSSLIVEVSSAAAADRLMDHGMIESHRECECEYFERGCRVTQCFRCFKMGHVAHNCKNKEFCHKCGKDHNPEKCTAAKERSHCAECQKEGHKPWQKTCPIRAETKKRADEVFRNRPYRYLANRGRSALGSSTTTAVASPARSHSPSRDGDESWTEVIGAKRRRMQTPRQRNEKATRDQKNSELKKPGRPTDIIRAAAQADQQRIPFTSSQ